MLVVTHSICSYRYIDISVFWTIQNERTQTVSLVYPSVHWYHIMLCNSCGGHTFQLSFYLVLLYLWFSFKLLFGYRAIQCLALCWQQGEGLVSYINKFVNNIQAWLAQCIKSSCYCIIDKRIVKVVGRLFVHLCEQLEADYYYFNHLRGSILRKPAPCDKDHSHDHNQCYKIRIADFWPWSGP